MVANQAAVAVLMAMGQNLVARLEGAKPEDRRRVMQVLDARVTATKGGFSVSLGVPPQVGVSVAGEDVFEANFLSCRPYDTLLQSGEGVKGLSRYTDRDFQNPSAQGSLADAKQAR